ncbi:MAG: M28 family peptidase, partial [Cyanobacteriota bacterium]|nr:M28 family peptidase [Cyanobacteriota bacterium]
LEVARLFGSKKTANSLEIVFFDREELGLLGSFDFTSRPENLEGLRYVIVLDMVGYACRVEGCQQYPPGLNVEPLLLANGITSPSKGEFLVVVGEAQHQDLLAAFSGLSPNLESSNLSEVVPLPIPFKGMLTPDVLRSDHAPFWYQNIAAVLVTDTANLRSPYYHQPSDTLDNLDRKFLMGSAQVIVHVVDQLLDAK